MRRLALKKITDVGFPHLTAAVSGCVLQVLNKTNEPLDLIFSTREAYF